MSTVKIHKLKELATIPTKGTLTSVGYDLYACLDEPVILQSGERAKISTGLSMEIPDNWWGGIFPRSGISFNKGLRLTNCVAVIDPDYRGEITVPIYNDSDSEQRIDHMDRIAQFVLMPRYEIEFEETDNLSETERGEGGFGSTDNK